MKNFVLPLLTDEQSFPFYVYCVGGLENQPSVDRVNGYNHYIWLHTMKGKGKLRLEGKDYILQPGAGILLYPHVPHEYHAIEDPWETTWVAFQGFAVPSVLQKLGLTQSGIFPVSNIQMLDRLVHDIFISAKSSSPDRGLKCSAKLYHFLIELRNYVIIDQSRSNAADHSRIEPVLTYLEDYYPNDITLGQLAGLIGASPQYLCRIFKQSMQMTPIVYLTKLRLQKAKELLLSHDDLSVTETAKRVGYRDTSYFCYVFKENEGMTPLEFRNS